MPALLNADTNEELVSNLDIADSFVSRFRGLLGRATLGENEGLLIRRCRMVHMFFMTFPIDVVFCTGGNEVCSIEEGLRPWRVSRSDSRASYVIELAAGAAARKSIVEGTRLAIR